MSTIIFIILFLLLFSHTVCMIFPIIPHNDTIILIVSVFFLILYRIVTVRETRKGSSILIFMLIKTMQSLNRAKKETQKENLNLRKIEIVNNLLSGITHDFNNMLSPILGYSTVIKKETEKDSNLYNYSHIIYSSCIRAMDFITQLKQLGKENTDAFTKIKLNLILLEARKSLNGMIESRKRNITLDYKISKDAHFIEGNINQLYHLVTNIQLNALESINKNSVGKITIRLKNIKVKNKMFGLRNADYVRFIVADNGKGIPKDILHKIFDPYFSTKRSDSAGLGLTRVKTIIDSHKAKLVLKTSKYGTVILIFFPAY